jgi:hypothetical protein
LRLLLPDDALTDGAALRLLASVHAVAGAWLTGGVPQLWRAAVDEDVDAAAAFNAAARGLVRVATDDAAVAATLREVMAALMDAGVRSAIFEAEPDALAALALPLERGEWQQPRARCALRLLAHFGVAPPRLAADEALLRRCVAAAGTEWHALGALGALLRCAGGGDAAAAWRIVAAAVHDGALSPAQLAELHPAPPAAARLPLPLLAPLLAQCSPHLPDGHVVAWVAGVLQLPPPTRHAALRALVRDAPDVVQDLGAIVRDGTDTHWEQEGERAGSVLTPGDEATHASAALALLFVLALGALTTAQVFALLGVPPPWTTLGPQGCAAAAAGVLQVPAPLVDALVLAASAVPQHDVVFAAAAAVTQRLGQADDWIVARLVAGASADHDAERNAALLHTAARLSVWAAEPWHFYADEPAVAARLVAVLRSAPLGFVAGQRGGAAVVPAAAQMVLRAGAALATPWVSSRRDVRDAVIGAAACDEGALVEALAGGHARALAARLAASASAAAPATRAVIDAARAVAALAPTTGDADDDADETPLHEPYEQLEEDDAAARSALPPRGTRVQRGPEWRGDDDVVHGAPGTLLGLRRGTVDAVAVRWVDGHVGVYRWGDADDAFDVVPAAAVAPLDAAEPAALAAARAALQRAVVAARQALPAAPTLWRPPPPLTAAEAAQAAAELDALPDVVVSQHWGPLG